MILRIDVLGPVRVVRDDGTPVEIRRPARRRLLSILALAGGRHVSTDILIDRFWMGDPPKTARAAIQTHVSGVRRDLGAEVIVTDPVGYRLNLGADGIDASTFDALAAEATRHASSGEWNEALDATVAALDCWRGEPYNELLYDDFALPEISRLREARISLRELEAEALIALGRPGEAVPELESLVLEHPLRQRLWELLMLARYRLGSVADALRAFRIASDHLAEVGLAPGERLRRLEEKVLLEEVALERPPNNLPMDLDSFVGRVSDRVEVGKLLEENRLVTLTGPGGAGKTRLATRLANDRLDVSPDGTWLVELGPLDDPDLVAAEIAGVIGVASEGEHVLDDLTERLKHDAVLIVLDNCEHLLEAAAFVAQQLLERCARLRLLATSRAPLRVPGESVYVLDGLTVPPHDLDVRDSFHHDAVRLFVDRAQLASRSFAFDPGNAAPIAEICRRLDGLPLAIELAAARVSALTPEEIAARLDDRLGVLAEGSPIAPRRHRTLEHAISWSYELLSAAERLALARLSVFRGGFDLTMAEAVISGSGIEVEEVASLVASLIDKSLVTRSGPIAAHRFRLLETIRSFASTALERSGEVGEAQASLLMWALGFSAEFWDGLVGPKVDELGLRVSTEFENLTSAVDIAFAEQRADDVSLLLAALHLHWRRLGYNSLVTDCVLRAIELCRDLEREAGLRSVMWRSLWASGRPDDAMAHALRAYELVADREPSVARHLAIWSLVRGMTLGIDTDTELAVGYANEGVANAATLGDPGLQSAALRNRAQVLARIGRHSDAARDSDRAIAQAIAAGDSRATLLACYDAITSAYHDRNLRRDRPREIVGVVFDRAESQEQITELMSDWLAQVYLQTGEWDAAEEILRRSSTARHLEGMAEESLLLPRAGLGWMRGDLAAAVRDIDRHEAIGVHERWYQDFYTVKANVLADLGDLDGVRKAVAEYLEADLHPTERLNTFGARAALVRAEVDAALQDGAPFGAATAARRSLDSMCAARAEFPVRHTGSPMWETHDTHLSFAAAEVSRLERSDPDLWRTAFGEADFVYYRLYAEWRLAEALLATGAVGEGGRHVAVALAEAERIGAALLVQRLRETAHAHDLPV